MAALPLFIYIERRTIYPARVYTYLIRPVESASPSSLSWTGPTFSHLLFPPPPKEGIRKKGNISSPPRLPTSAFLLPRVRLTFPHPYIYSLDSGPRRAPHHLFIYRQHQRGKKRKKKRDFYWYISLPRFLAYRLTVINISRIHYSIVIIRLLIAGHWKLTLQTEAILYVISNASTSKRQLEW